jgi:2-phosphosulfolactate phosphatase
MQITVFGSSKYFKPGELTDKTAVIIDLLRTSSTIVTALERGCDRVIPAVSPNDAVEIKKASGGEVLLGGEIGAQDIQGFDLGNSPLEYKEADIAEKTIAYTTANGTVAIKRCEAAPEILIGCMLNARAVAKAALDLDRDTALVCAGTRGKFSMDDVIAAGCILDRILSMDASVEMDDLARVALKMYRDAAGGIIDALKGSSHYEYLTGLGLQGDIAYCVQEDLYEVVPVYKEGIIVK